MSRLKRIVTAFLTHGAAFGGGLLFERIRRGQNVFEQAARGHDPLSEERAAISFLLEFLRRNEAIAVSQAVIVGVMARAEREVEGGLGFPLDAEEAREQTYKRTLATFQGADRPDLLPVFELGATIAAEYTKAAVMDPKACLPSTLEEETAAVLARAMARMESTGLAIDGLRSKVPLMRELSARWHRDGESVVFTGTLDHIVSAASRA